VTVRVFGQNAVSVAPHALGMHEQAEYGLLCLAYMLSLRSIYCPRHDRALEKVAELEAPWVPNTFAVLPGECIDSPCFKDMLHVYCQRDDMLMSYQLRLVEVEMVGENLQGSEAML